MADREKIATCPICGYTDTALDAVALKAAMEDHMRSAHNQVLNSNEASMDIKPTGVEERDRPVITNPVEGGTAQIPLQNNQ